MKPMPRINEFIELISNIMESYTTTLFLADDSDGGELTLYYFYSLSKNIKKDCKVQSGEGIIGWVFREQKSVLASYFDKRDATTLKFYEKDEDIKSLVAIPLPENYGVLCVDSKKSYVFTEEKEKILRQMSQVLVSMINLEKEINEKKIVENLLSLSVNTNEIIVNTKDKNEFTKEFLELLIERIHFELVGFVYEDKIVSFTYKLNNKNIYKELSYDYFDQYGLIGWVLKNKKELFLEKLSRSEKSFIVNRNEPFENVTNFLCLPLISKKHKKTGALAFVKKVNEKWISKEKKTISLLSNLFFKEYLNKK
ncbi:GAF domain-containing protein [Patescibacteria group bacterium]|nr:GAF domain-containing protein [Patescibacteria group bacterium]